MLMVQWHYNHIWKIDDKNAKIIWIDTVIIVDQTKYLCKPNNFLLFSSEHMPFIQPKLNEQVNIRKIKNTPAKMPLQKISVCPRIKVVILITPECELNSVLFSRCRIFYCKQFYCLFRVQKYDNNHSWYFGRWSGHSLYFDYLIRVQ